MSALRVNETKITGEKDLNGNYFGVESIKQVRRTHVFCIFPDFLLMPSHLDCETRIFTFLKHSLMFASFNPLPVCFGS